MNERRICGPDAPTQSADDWCPEDKKKKSQTVSKLKYKHTYIMKKRCDFNMFSQVFFFINANIWTISNPFKEQTSRMNGLSTYVTFLVFWCFIELFLCTRKNCPKLDLKHVDTTNKINIQQICCVFLLLIAEVGFIRSTLPNTDMYTNHWTLENRVTFDQDHIPHFTTIILLSLSPLRGGKHREIKIVFRCLGHQFFQDWNQTVRTTMWQPQQDRNVYRNM